MRKGGVDCPIGNLEFSVCVWGGGTSLNVTLTLNPTLFVGEGTSPMSL